MSLEQFLVNRMRAALQAFGGTVVKLGAVLAKRATCGLLGNGIAKNYTPNARMKLTQKHVNLHMSADIHR